MEEKFYYSSSTLATIIQNVAITFLVIGIIASLIMCTENLGMGIVSGIVSVVGFLVAYSLGEIIKLLHDIRENTEHLRDKIEEK